MAAFSPETVNSLRGQLRIPEPLSTLQFSMAVFEFLTAQYSTGERAMTLQCPLSTRTNVWEM